MEAATTEQPVPHASGVIPGNCVRISGAPARVGAPEPSTPEPTIALVRSGDVVRAMEIVCPCGRHIHVHCQYD